MDEFERRLRQGPALARVESLDPVECTLPSDVSGFTILR
jgi:hypothetical protein